jgi:hypothetical protein
MRSIYWRRGSPDREPPDISRSYNWGVAPRRRRAVAVTVRGRQVSVVGFPQPMG